MWDAPAIEALRTRLGMDRSNFGKLLGVDGRTVWRWENKKGKPTGAAVSVLNGIQQGLQENPSQAGAIAAALIGGVAVGGLAFLIFKMISDLAED